MNDDALQAALARLERAVGRVEAVSGHGGPAGDGIDRPRAPQPGLAEAYALLDERHALLRMRVQDTIDRLDTLIAGPAQE